MASAIQLTAQNTIINGQGLAANSTVISEITSFRSHTPITLIANIFTNASSSNSSASVLASLANLGVGVTQGQWLIDFYPSNITPVSSGGVTYYGIYVNPVYGTGIHANDIVGYSNVAITNTASMSSTILTQVNLPFINGVQSFANVYQTASGYAGSVFDTVASVYLLKGKTYAQSGIGYTGPRDLSTGGIGNTGALISNVISTWGTMYDINNISTISNPYVFGQNLLNQGLGSYGNLAAQLSAAGLNTNNLTQVPQNSQTVSQAPSTFTATTSVGQVSLPTLANVINNTKVSGNSTDVITSIFKSITGTALQAIQTATNVTIANASITSLNDYLNFNTIVSPATLAHLNSIGVTDFPTFTALLQKDVGQGYFSSWSSIIQLLSAIENPTLNYTTANANSLVLSNTIANNLLATLGTGSGPFNTPVINDYLGAVVGNPYNANIATLNTNYSTVLTGAVSSAVSNLDQAVIDYNNEVSANVGPPNITMIDSNVSAVNSALNSIPSSAALTASQQAYYTMLNHLTSEVNNLNKAGIVFNSGYPQTLQFFGKSIGQTASDKTDAQTYQFFANLITPDVYGDTIRLAIAEFINTQELATAGINLTNDPNPAGIIAQANQQNIPLSTYINQNK